MGCKKLRSNQRMDPCDVPLQFVKRLNNRKHVVLFYDDYDYARKIEFQFIKKGLEKGEHCIYATEEDPGFIILSMTNHGIAVKNYLKNKLLHVYQILDAKKGGLLQSAKNNLDRILADSKPPFRIISRIVSDVSTARGISAELTIEDEFHKSFCDFKGTVICPYDITKIENNKTDKNVVRLFEHHHAAIYALKSKQGGVFYLQ